MGKEQKNSQPSRSRSQQTEKNQKIKNRSQNSVKDYERKTNRKNDSKSSSSGSSSSSSSGQSSSSSSVSQQRQNRREHKNQDRKHNQEKKNEQNHHDSQGSSQSTSGSVEKPFFVKRSEDSFQARESFKERRNRLRSIMRPSKFLLFDYESDQQEYQREMQENYKRRNIEKKILEERENKREEEERQQKLKKIKQQDDKKQMENENQQVAQKNYEEQIENGDYHQEVQEESENHVQEQSVHSSSSSSQESDSHDSDEEEDQQYARKVREKNEAKHRKLEQEVIIGPVPILGIQGISGKANYGDKLLPGEGSAMAQYISEGRRIPRRGQVGLTSEQIQNYEQLGYVMSGSRHKRMTAVRERKEAQVYSAQEQIAFQIYQYEEKIKQENMIIDNFKQVLQDQVKNQ